MSRIIYKKIEEHDNTYRIQATIGKTSISLVIFEEANTQFNAYTTPMILEQNLKKQADQLGVSLQNYYEKLISFLENPQKVKFSFNKKSLLILESVNSNLQVKYFHCDVCKVDDFSSFVGSFIDDIQEESLKSEEKLNELTEKNRLLEKGIEEYKLKLNELVQRKNVDEQLMISNFVSLLNEKKRRIQHLNELLEAFKTNRNLANPVEVNTVSNQKKRKRINLKTEEPSSSRVKEEVSDSSSNYEHDTTDSEQNEEIADIKSENTANTECFDDIFDEPPKILPSLPNISRKPPSTVSSISVQSSTETEKLNESKNVSNSDNTVLHQSKRFDTPVVHINTQDWLDRL